MRWLPVSDVNSPIAPPCQKSTNLSEKPRAETLNTSVIVQKTFWNILCHHFGAFIINQFICPWLITFFFFLLHTDAKYFCFYFVFYFSFWGSCIHFHNHHHLWCQEKILLGSIAASTTIRRLQLRMHMHACTRTCIVSRIKMWWWLIWPRKTVTALLHKQEKVQHRLRHSVTKSIPISLALCWRGISNSKE